MKVPRSSVPVGGEPPRRPRDEASFLADRWHIIGVGSPVAGDDLGWMAIDALRAAGLAGAHELRTLDRPGAALIEHLTPGARVILLDAMEAELPPGSVRELNLDDLIATAHPPSSHQLGLAETLALAQALGAWPRRLYVLGIQTVLGLASPDSASPDPASPGPVSRGLTSTASVSPGSVGPSWAHYDAMGCDTDGSATMGADWRQRACAEVVARVRVLLEVPPDSRARPAGA